MHQVTKPDLTIVGLLGYCLLYVRGVFDAPWAGSDAWTSWNKHTKLKHSGEPPKGVYVPIWFDGYWKGERLGHVAVYKDGKVWSSPYKTSQNFAALNSIAETERIYGMKYVGWSEDIGGKIIVKKGNTMDEWDVKELFLTGIRREAKPAELKAWVGLKPADLARGLRTEKDWLTQNHYVTYFPEREKRIKELENELANSKPNPDAEKVNKYNQIEKIVKG